ncbi:hypothetical protein [Bradyrhizobium vignae]|uniref:hypothetical protein n=1 Tax=Bradyrhizobium vignae TaxID=1549949 RepID=UPI00100AA47E|nr:hypothetical protein [Bradyrhizobium vignae]RXG97224.1 hypothetical protein EAV90_22975 [Bradyrhizobium vignae]
MRPPDQLFTGWQFLGSRQMTVMDETKAAETRVPADAELKTLYVSRAAVAAISTFGPVRSSGLQLDFVEQDHRLLLSRRLCSPRGCSPNWAAERLSFGQRPENMRGRTLIDIRYTRA